MITRAMTVAKVLGAGFFLAVLVSFTAYVFLQMQNTYAQTPTPAPEGAQAGIIILEVSPSKVLSVPKDKPQSLELEFRSLKSEAGERVVLPSGDVDVRDATFKGVVRYVLVGKRKVGQLVLTEVSSGRKTERLTPNKYVHQWDLKRDVVGRANSFKIKAKRTELMAVFASLTRKVGDAGVGGKRGEGATKAKTAASSGGGGGAGKSDATSYKPPTGGGKVPEIDVQITTDGCTVRVDMAQGVSIQQSKSITTEDGKVTDTSECGDSDTRYKLVQSFACEDKVNQGTGIVQAQFKWYYDKEGTKVEVSECQADAERFFKITEETGECAVKIDLAAGTASPQTALVYTNTNNEKVQVRGCAPSSKVASATLEDTADGCALRKVNGLDVQFNRKIYVLDGTTYEAKGCESGTGETVSRTTSGCVVRIDTDQLFAIQQSKTQNIKGGSVLSEGSCEDTDTRYVLKRDYDVCSVDVDVDKREATEQYGHYYTISGRKVAVAGCEADDRNIYAVTEKVSTCDARVDIRSRKVYPKAILVYQDHKGVEVEVRGCEVATTIAAVAITSTQNGCVAVKRHTGLTHEQERLVYVLSGKTEEARGCLDNGKSWWFVVDGCGLRTDKGAGKVFVQKRKFYFVNGRNPTTESCTDSDKSYDLVTSYDTCEYAVSDGVKVGDYAYAQYEMYYFDDLGTKGKVQACMKDEEKKYRIKEQIHKGNALVCSHDANLGASPATVRIKSKLVYGGETIEEKVARDCRNSEAYPILVPMTPRTHVSFETKLCSPDFAHYRDQDYSRVKVKWTYKVEGREYSIGECQEYGDRIAHEEDYDLCKDDSPYLKRKVYFLHGLVKIDVSNGCELVATSDLQSEYCTGDEKWNHAFRESKSFRQVKFYFEVSGDKHYKSGCQNSDKFKDVYFHDTVFLTGADDYDHNDNLKLSYGYAKIVIQSQIPPLEIKARYKMATSSPYTKENSKDEKTRADDDLHVKCTKTEPTEKVQYWKRNDGTTYKEWTGRVGTSLTDDVCEDFPEPVTKKLIVAFTTKPRCLEYIEAGNRKTCKRSDTIVDKNYYETWKRTTRTNIETLKIGTVIYTRVSPVAAPVTLPFGVTRSKTEANIKANVYKALFQ